jgi:hypothetical protein
MMAVVHSANRLDASPTTVPPTGGVPTGARRAREVWARAIRRDVAGLRDPRRLAAIVIVGIAGGLIVAWLYARGDLVGADARAYWAAVRVWLGGGDPYNPGGTFLPYAYAPWLLPIFLPWALLPWDVAWTVWEGSMVILFAWSFTWAFRRHALATALLIAVLALPLTATLDTGNVTLYLALAIWAAQFTGPVVGGALWALATGMKWFPALLLVMLQPRARLWGLVFLAIAGVLTLVMWRETLVQLDIVLNFPRPLRIDYLLILWAFVPWLWRHPDPLWWLERAHLASLAERTRNGIAAWLHEIRRSPGAAVRHAGRSLGAAFRAFFGIESHEGPAQPDQPGG